MRSLSETYKTYTIAIDFDGTCVKHEYPNIGEDIGAVPVLRDLVHSGHKLVLNTMRSGKELEDAVNWFKINDIELYGINENPTQKKWTDSPKVFANYYIDDAALGTPLINKNNAAGYRNYVDWTKMRELIEMTMMIFRCK